ncbi:MAG: ecotin family protein [Calditrichaceae bacterium]|jgi:ecotin
MKRIMTLGFLFTVIFLYAGHSEYIDAFPKAEAGMERYVLNLQKQKDESALKVELIIGKIVKTDKNNKYFYYGSIKEDVVKGWGFTYYKLDSLGEKAGTMMAVNPNTPQVKRFIPLGGEPFLIRYNSRVPIVVYVPEDVIVKYRIWTAESEMKTMKNG